MKRLILLFLAVLLHAPGENTKTDRSHSVLQKNLFAEVKHTCYVPTPLVQAGGRRRLNFAKSVFLTFSVFGWSISICVTNLMRIIFGDRDTGIVITTSPVWLANACSGYFWGILGDFVP